MTDLIALDRKFPELLRAMKATAGATGDVDLSKWCVVMDQGQVNSCVGNATCEAIEILDNMSGYKATPLSRLFVYAMARTLGGNLDSDSGTEIRLAFQALSSVGVCDEYLWPYDDTKVLTSPSLMAQRQALGHQISTAYRIDSVGADRLQACLDALHANHPIVFGTQVDDAFENLNNANPVGPPAGATVGGHAMCVVGYTSGKGWRVKNSWGPDWGDGGFWWMTDDYLTWASTDDLWVPETGTSF